MSPEEKESKWIVGDLVELFEDGTFGIRYWDEDHKFKQYEVWTDTIGQFTGLIDKFGRRIYEGDIIVQHGDSMPDIRGEVVYDEMSARFGMSYKSYWESGCVTHFETLERVKCYSDKNREMTYEVIGNVHDHYDLMLEKDINVFKCET